jgi:hypothetical protein
MVGNMMIPNAFNLIVDALACFEQNIERRDVPKATFTSKIVATFTKSMEAYVKLSTVKQDIN